MSTVFFEPTEQQRQELRELPGAVFEEEKLVGYLREQRYEALICVGDRVSKDVVEAGLEPDIVVVDGKIQREAMEEELEVTADIELAASNPAGSITEEAWNAVKQACTYECSVALDIEGEEDMLGLPSILFAPKDAAVVYGQWNRGGVVVEPDESMQELVREMVGIQRYDHLIVGGSWDRFHIGHRYLLLTAFEQGREVDIGITSDRMLAEKLEGEDAWNYERRKEAVEQFVSQYGYEDRVRILEIDDFCGNAVEEGDALLVTDETTEAGRLINEKRRKAGRSLLELVEVERITAADGKPVSSSRIRRGEINRNGRCVEE